MAVEDHFGRPDHQLWNQLFDDNESVISYEDGYPCTPADSSQQGSEPNFSNVVDPMSYLNAPYVPSNQANSGISFDESSLITCLNSPSSGRSYSHGLGYSQVDSLSPILASPMTMIKNPSLETMLDEPLLPNNPSQMTFWQAMQWKCYNDYVRIIQENQNPYRLNIQPLLHEAGELQQVANTVVTAELAIRRLKSYVHDRRHRPPDNNIWYWRSFVSHYYSPLVKRKTCFSKYAHVGGHPHGVFVLVEPRNCEICGSTSRKGFVETFDALPRLNQLYFKAGGVVDELMHLDLSSEKRLPDGSLMLCFAKAIQESMYQNCRVVHEGQLQVVFTPQLKIISWDFCVQHHEVNLPRRLIAAQVNEVIKGATISKSNLDTQGRGVIQKQDLTSNGNRIAAAARKLAATVEQPHVSDLGLAKHFVRSLQVSELLNVMKDLMTESLNNGTSPIETLKRYGRKTTRAKLGTKPMKLKSPMQQTSGPPEHMKHPAQNARLIIKTSPIQTPINYHDGIYYNSPAHCQKHLYTPEMMQDVYPSPFNRAASYLLPFQSPMAPAQSSPRTEEFVLNDLLEHMQRQATKRAQSENVYGETQKKSSFNVSPLTNEVTVDQFNVGKAKNGKALNSSSSSSNSRILPDHNHNKRVKRPTEIDENFCETPTSIRKGI